MAFDKSVLVWLKYSVFLLLCVNVHALIGDYTELQTLYAVFDLALPDACFLLPGEYSLLLDLGDYTPLEQANCRDVGAPLHQLMGTGIIADSATLDAVRLRAWTDAIGSFALVLVCLLLSIDLWLRGRLSGRVQRVLRAFRVVLYGTLLVAAVYQGMVGGFLDVRGSAFWLLAFICIELQVLSWQRNAARGWGNGLTTDHQE